MQYVKKETFSKVLPVSPDTQLAGPSAERQNNVAQATNQNGPNPARAEPSNIVASQKPRVSTSVEKTKEKESMAGSPVPSDNEGASEKSGSEAELTRSLGTRSAAVSLSNVKTIYVTLIGNLPANESLRHRLIEDLRASKRLAPAHNRGEAEALMKVSSRKSIDLRPENASVFVQLINARGDIIWPTARTSSGGNYQGAAAAVSRSIVQDLLGEIRSLQK